MRAAIHWPLLVAGLLAPAAGWAADAPHDYSSSPGVGCNSCHTLHTGPGMVLTATEGNSNLCFSCHKNSPNFAWNDANQASPGASGHSHRWDSDAVKPGAGAGMPQNTEVLLRIQGNGGKLMCSACHNQHTGASDHKGRQRVSVAIGTPVTRTGPPVGFGDGTLVVNQPNANANPKGYRVQVVTAGAQGVSTFRVSNDNGYSWWGWQGGVWTADAPAGRPTGASVALNDGNNVTVTFSGTGSFAVDDRWDFYVSYPFLRMANANSELCETCHQTRLHSSAHTQTDGGVADGTYKFSHPVGVAMGGPTTRGADQILDCDGTLQDGGSTDTNHTNNLRLDTQGKVRCMTCHSPHHADSNSKTEDPR